MDSELEGRPSKIRKLNSTEQDSVSSTQILTGHDNSESSVAHETRSPVPDTTHTNDTTANSPRVGEKALETEPTTTGQDGEPATAPPMSKNALKKLRKAQEWEAGREDRKVARKEKGKARKERKREEKRLVEEHGGPQNGVISNAALGGKEPRGKLQRSVQLPVTIIMDCSWEELMTEKELISLGSQLTRSYSDNSKANFRAHLAISSFGGRLKERYDTVLEKQYLGWKGVRFLEGDFVEVAEQAKAWMAPEAKGGLLKGQFNKFESAEDDLQQQGEVIYLSSDSENILTELKPYSTYILGGLVDKNRYKGICHQKADEKRIKTAKLPIGDYMQMASRFVLTVNHVNEIMLRWLEVGDWGQAFDAVIPKRKGGVLKGPEAAEADDGEEAEDADQIREPAESVADTINVGAAEEKATPSNIQSQPDIQAEHKEG